MRFPNPLRPALILGLFLQPALTGFAGFRQIHTPARTDPMGVHVYQLDNGLTVYLSENRETPRFAARVSVRAGSKHDPADSTGLAHYLEHLLFKGTTALGTTDYEKERVHLDRITELYEQHFRTTDPARRRAIYEEINRENRLASQYAIPNELDRLFNSMGAELFNAHTGSEETVYEVNLPINQLEQWAHLEFERFRAPVFRLFQTELEVVYEEKNRALDSKERLIQEAVRKVLFKKHPYGQQTTLGEVEHLKNPSLRNVQAYYDRHYVPGNMAVAISGAIDPAETIRLIDRVFSAWPARPVPAQPSWEEAPLQGAERVSVNYQGEEYVLLSFRGPGRNHPDADAWKFVDMVLDNSVAGLINLNLNQQQRVRAAGSWPELNNDYGAQMLWGTPKAGQSLAEVERLLLEQVERVKRGEFENWIVPAILADFKKMRSSAYESNDDRANLMSEAFLSFQDWRHVAEELNRLSRITKADIVRAANKYFTGNYVAGYRRDAQQEIPQIEKPAIDPIDIVPTRESAFAARIEAMPVAPIQPAWISPGRDYSKIEIEQGATLTLVRNPVNDLFEFGLTIDMGSRHDIRLPMAARLLDKAGTRRFNPEALKKEWYRLGTTFAITVGENETRLTLSGLDENFRESWDLMLSLLTEPVADQATLDELTAIFIAQRADSKKDFATLIQAVRQYNRYGANSAYLRALPDERVAALRADELLGLIRNLAGMQRSLDYSGKLAANSLRTILRRRPAAAAPVQAPPPYRFFAAATPARDRVFIHDKPLAQAQVYLEFADGTYNEANVPLVNLFNDYFWGSMSGIVFQELREARALAYAADGIYSAAARKEEQNIVIGYIGTQADKTAEAVSGFLGLFERMPVSGERFEAAQDSVETRYRTGKLTFREIAGAVRAWEKLEVPIDPRPARFAALQDKKLEDIVNFQKEHARGSARLISIVGDRSKFNLEELSRTADIEFVDLSKIFSF